MVGRRSGRLTQSAQSAQSAQSVSEARAGLDAARAMWRRWMVWFREPHFLEKTSLCTGVAMVVTLIIMPPDSPLQMLFALGWLVLVAMLPFAPRTLCIIGPVLCLIASAMPHPGWWTAGDFLLIASFLCIGYTLPRWPAIGMQVGYAVLDGIGAAWFAFPSLGGGLIRGVIEALNDLNRQTMAEDGMTIASHAEAALPQYSLVVFVATLALDLMVLGFLRVFGTAFRRTAEADARAERTELLLGRITREQELAHVIHDSVANDMSTIAMLAWRAKAMDDDAELLDAIYARSHHALDRVHEVIDVLNGKRELEELRAGVAGAGVSGEAFGADHEAGVSDMADMADMTEAESVASAADRTPIDAHVEKYVEDQDRAMSMLGLHGVSRLHAVPGVMVSAAVQRATMGLLEEIYANIVRHCALEDQSDDGAGRTLNDDEPAYSLFIDITQEGIRINEINMIADESQTLVHQHRQGRGLTMQRATIEALGGTLNTSAQDGTWTLGAEIPLA
ncbi:hypothetical protein [Bifidobacterium olomucense]|uniref:Histidine kinase n=1 Tax=Bifidobacterium olomucense TaxID=2675324 RepID=A0A7Y0EY23_9BIFI|nr:hypothetical protein [Bifidobacterium sp. DSM 109959]NMM98469.1 hypothetical protein [Bifidobacterium sp. DSM 109959]